jgi:paraquat-inducible protein B
MARKVSPTLIGAFVVAGLALLATAIVFIAGNDLFKRKDRAVMYFRGSIYGLQVGAPVVFRGVRVGSVTSIEVVYDRANDRFVIPVVAELDRDAVRGIDGPRDASTRRGDAPPLAALVQRGLRAQLQMQSLLTGLLYVDIDIRPQRQPASARLPAPGETPDNPVVAQQATEIPTTDTAVQALKNQLDGMDFRRLLEDVSAIAGSARAIVSGPELRTALNDLQAITGSVKRLSARLEQRIDPLVGAADSALARAGNAAQRVGDAASEVGQTARSLARTSDSVGRAVAPDSVLMLRLQEAAAQVAHTAAALQSAADSPEGVVRQTQRTLQDLSRAARALRELADSLERQPQSLLRGRPAEDPPTDRPPTEPQR